MKCWWVSWYQPTDDMRPLTDPPTEGVCGWWSTGMGDSGHTLCAAVFAPNEAEAKFAVKVSWPEAVRWRFCEEQEDGFKLSNRFHISREWERERVDAANAAVKGAPKS